MEVGDGRNTRFWHDCWCGESALSCRFNHLFHLDVNKDDSLADKWVDGKWQWIWSRLLGSRHNQLLIHLQEEISFCHFSDRPDSWTFTLNEDGVYTVKAVRDLIDRKLLPSSNIKTDWFKFVPRKVNIFLWRFKLNALPVRWNLSAKDIDINSVVCPLCNNGIESRDHLFSSVQQRWTYGLRYESG
ncbi:uncharacterized protein [Rutidosis leptorrhynchoides]|uniref:uncharacterized protein n=1 Tax=Rutidosis leptorrhynchoides TaxID=125765 RepID=UPI003A9A2E65